MIQKKVKEKSDYHCESQHVIITRTFSIKYIFLQIINGLYEKNVFFGFIEVQ